MTTIKRCILILGLSLCYPLAVASPPEHAGSPGGVGNPGGGNPGNGNPGGGPQGEPEEKVAICHVPPGNPDNAHTISIGASAVPKHVGKHEGDTEGACEGGADVPAGGNVAQFTICSNVDPDMCRQMVVEPTGRTRTTDVGDY